MITGYLRQAASWIGFSIDGLGRMSTFAVESKLLLVPAAGGYKMTPAIFKNIENQRAFRFAAQACRVRFFFVAVASLSFAVQLLPLNGDTQTSETTESPAASASNSSKATTTGAVNV